MARIDIGDLRERCRALPQNLVLELLGFRQWIELQRFADKWRLPVGGKTTDLFAVFRELRSFVAKYGVVLAALLDDLPADGSDGELGVRYLRAKISKTEADAMMAQLRVSQKEGRLCDRELIHESLLLLSERIRRTSDTAIRRWGNDAADMFEQLANGFGDDLETMFGNDKQPATDAALTSQPQ